MAMRSFGVFAALVMGGSANVAAQPRDLRAEVADILTTRPIDRIISGRALCASGARGRLAGAFDSIENAGPAQRVAVECIALLTRSARDGRLDPIRSNEAPSAAAIDAGFMAGYQQTGPLPGTLPGMAALRPIADRCLMQREVNVRLCSATGYALGMRARHGEVVQAD